MVAQDEASLGAIDTFAAEQGVGGETAEDLNNGIIREAGQCVPLVGGLLHFINVQHDESSLVMRSLKRKIIQQRSISEV